MPSAIANKSSARMTKRYSVLRCRAISSTIFRDLADRSIFGEVLLGTWTLTMIDVDCFKCRFYHSKSEVENFRKAPLDVVGVVENDQGMSQWMVVYAQDPEHQWRILRPGPALTMSMKGLTVADFDGHG